MADPPEVVVGMGILSQLLVLSEGFLRAGVEQAAGDANFVRQVDQSGGLDALRKLESRLRAAEDEVSEFKLKVCTRRNLATSSGVCAVW